MSDQLADIAMVRDMRRVAAYGEIHPLRPNARYLARCRRVLWDRGVSVLFTRDTGHHSTGWWKNPDYERCWHLSLGFFDPIARKYVTHDKSEAARGNRSFTTFTDALVCVLNVSTIDA